MSMKYYVANDIRFVHGMGGLVDNPESATHFKSSKAYDYICIHPDHKMILCSGKKKTQIYVISTPQKFIDDNGDITTDIKKALSFNTSAEAFEYIDDNKEKLEKIGQMFVINEKFRKAIRVATHKNENCNKDECTNTCNSWNEEAVDFDANGEDDHLDDEKNQKVTRKKLTQKQRHALYVKSQVCDICGKWVSEYDSTIDHIIPISRGGTNDMDNLRLIHYECNQLKGNLLDEELDSLAASVTFNNIYNDPSSELGIMMMRAKIRGTIKLFRERNYERLFGEETK